MKHLLTALLLFASTALQAQPGLHLVADAHSYGTGFGYTPFPVYVGKKYGITVQNFSVNAQTISQMLSDEVSQVLSTYDSTKVNIILLCEGGNDIYMYRDVDSAVARHIRYAAIARARGWKVIIATNIRRHQYIINAAGEEQYNAWLVQFNAAIVAASASFDGIIRPDLDPLFTSYYNGGYSVSDLYHPGALGQQRYADLYIAAINRLYHPGVTMRRKIRVQ